MRPVGLDPIDGSETSRNSHKAGGAFIETFTYSLIWTNCARHSQRRLLNNQAVESRWMDDFLCQYPLQMLPLFGNNRLSVAEKKGEGRVSVQRLLL